MTNSMEPKTDRELLLMIAAHQEQLIKDVNDIKEKLSDTIDSDFCDRQHVVIERRLNDHSKRILVLDNWRWYTMGGFALFIIIITFILQLSRL